jgi:hypothetical protein
MGVIVISLGTPRSAGENFGCTWEHQGTPTASLRAPGNADDKTGISDDKSGCTEDNLGSIRERRPHAWERLQSL